MLLHISQCGQIQSSPSAAAAPTQTHSRMNSDALPGIFAPPPLQPLVRHLYLPNVAEERLFLLYFQLLPLGVTAEDHLPALYPTSSPVALSLLQYIRKSSQWSPSLGSFV